MYKHRLRWWVCAAALTWCSGAWAAVVGELEGVAIDDTATVAGTKLVLNGAAVRKRGYFKTDVTTIYLADKRNTLPGIYKLGGAKRIQLDVLRDISGPVITKYFLSDFKLVTTEEEFKQLITAVGLVGDIYGRIGQVKKGDRVTIDWIPGKGLFTRFNGKPMPVNTKDGYENNELLYQIFLRMYVGERAASDYRNGLLGLDDRYKSAAADVTGTVSDGAKPTVKP